MAIQTDKRPKSLNDKTYYYKHTTFVVYADTYDHWNVTLKANYDTIKDKGFTKYICRGTKQKCEKKAEAHNNKMGMSISTKYLPHVVYKDEMGLFYVKPEILIDCGTPVYKGTLKECRAFIEGTSVNQTDYWFVILDEEGEFETVSNNKGGDLILYSGKAQDCNDFVGRLSNLGEVFKSIYSKTFKSLRENGTSHLDINQFTLGDLVCISVCLQGIEVLPRDLSNSPLLTLLYKHNFIRINTSGEVSVYEYKNA